VRVAFGDDLECHLQGLGPGGEFAGVPGIGPDQADAPAGTVGVPQQRPGALAVLDAGGCDHHVQDQAGGVHGDVALAAVDLLGVIPAPVALGTVSAARTDWESMTAAVGSGLRPAAARAWARSWLCSRARVPSSRQAAK
jgi:hypothetical protein